MKQLKILLIIVVLLGVIVGISLVSGPGEGPGADLQSSENSAYIDLEKQINSDFGGSAKEWKESVYERHLSNIRNKEKELLFDAQAASVLRTHLKLESCYLLNRLVKTFFKQTSYPQDQVNHLASAIKYMNKEISNEMNKGSKEINENLREVTVIMNDYQRLYSFINSSFTQQAFYSHPLPAFNMEKYKERLNAIEQFKSSSNYQTYFSKNPTVRNDLEGVKDKLKAGHRTFLVDLEVEIERHYNQLNEINYDDLVKDQIAFSNAVAKYGSLSDVESRLAIYVKRNKPQNKVEMLQEYLKKK